MIGSIVLVIVLIAAIYNAGWLPAMVVATVCGSASMAVFLLRRSAEKGNGGRFLQSLVKILTACVKVCAVIFLAVGVLMLVVGLFTSGGTLSFQGESCGLCSGTGIF